MNDLMHNPIFLSLILAPLSAVILIPLLKWAMRGDKSDIYGSLGLGLACVMAAIAAFGKPESLFVHGPQGLVGVLIFMSISAALLSAFVAQPHINRALSAIVTFIAIWASMALPFNLGSVFLAWPGFLLLGFACICLQTSACRYERWPALIMLVVVQASLAVMSWLAGDLSMLGFNLGLLMLSGVSMVVMIPRLSFKLQENGFFVMAFATAMSLGWLAFNEKIPLLSFAFMLAVSLAPRAVVGFLKNKPEWTFKFYIPLLLVFCLIPAVFSLIFFDILEKI